MTVSDASLIGRLASDPTGDGLRTLYRRYAGELYGFALNSLRDRGLAEEVVQDTFTSVWRHADRFDPERELPHLAVRAGPQPDRGPAPAGLRAARRWRRRGRGEEPGEVDRSLDEAMLRWQVAAALARLSPEHREVLRLAHFQALSLREIAEALGLPLGTVKSRTYYALRHLRLVLDEMEVGP